jgi:hypothetical protein
MNFLTRCDSIVWHMKCSADCVLSPAYCVCPLKHDREIMLLVQKHKAAWMDAKEVVRNGIREEKANAKAEVKANAADEDAKRSELRIPEIAEQFGLAGL